MDAEFLESRIEKCCRAGDSDIGRQREIQSRADGGAVDGRDGRQGAIRDGQESVVDDAQSVLGGFPRAVRSAPAQKALPAPVTMTACTSVFASAAMIAARRAAEISAVTALRRSGSLTVTVAT